MQNSSLVEALTGGSACTQLQKGIKDFQLSKLSSILMISHLNQIQENIEMLNQNL